MSKNRTKGADTQEFEMLDLEEMLQSSVEEETMLEMFSCIASIDRDQSQVSLELTKLIVEHAGGAKLKEKEILLIFEKAKATVPSCSPLQEMFQRISS